MSNSSGSVERFLLGLNEAKTFETLAPGGNAWAIDIVNPINQGIDGTLATGGNANVVVALQTAEAAVLAAASLTTNLTGATDNDLVFTSKVLGTTGNSVSVAYSDPGGVTATASIAVVGQAITISLGRATSAVNTTANDVAALINGFAPAAALVSVANKAGNVGTGLVAAMAATNLAGGLDGAGPATFATVGSAVTVVPGGKATLTGATGRFAKILNTGSGLASVVAKPLHRIQPYQSL